jgi:recombination protein RecA
MTKNDDDKLKAADLAIAQIERQHGKGAIMRLGSDTAVDVPSISTGSIGLDLAIGVGGVPRGRVIEIYGPEASGKTTLAFHIVAQAQMAGGMCGFIDAEHAVDPEYCKTLGVNLDELLVSQPDSGEQALEIAETLVRSAALDVLVVDSVAALVPRAEIEGEMGDTQPGLQARLMSKAMRKLTHVVSKSQTTLVFINQVREKIGVMFGNPEVTPGGRALKFYSSVRIDIRRIGSIKEGDRIVGNRTRAKVVKNKVAAPFRMAEFEIIYGFGISREGELLDMGEEQGIVQKSGSWYSVEGEKIGQGRENARRFLLDNPDIAATIENKLREAYGLPSVNRPIAESVDSPADAPTEEVPAPGKPKKQAK